MNKKLIAAFAAALAVAALTAGCDREPSEREKRQWEALQWTFSECKRTVNAIDGGRLTVKENGKLYRACTDMGPVMFRERMLAAGVRW